MPANQPTVLRPKDLRVPRRVSIRPDYQRGTPRDETVEVRHVRAVGAATVLLAVCFLVITTLIYTHMSDDTRGDEIAWFAIAFFLGSIGLSCLALRQAAGSWHAVWTDRLLLIGLAILTVAMVVVGIDLS